MESYNTRGHPAYLCRDNKSVQQMLKRWASQALSPVTLMITLLLSSLKSGAKVQLIIDIDKEKGIYLCEDLFFLQYRFFLKMRFS